MPPLAAGSHESPESTLSPSQKMATVQIKRPRGGPAPAAIQSNEGLDAVSGDLASGAPNTDLNIATSTVDSTPPSSRIPRAAPAPSPAPRHPPSIPSPYAQSQDKLDISPDDKQTRKRFLREAYFPDWKDDAASADLGSPDEMQKKDPLGTQIWKLYSKTKAQLPNQERMENLTWRMMAMNLKRKEREQARYVQNRRLACILQS